VSRFYQLGEDGKYQRIEPIDGIYESKVVPGFRLPVDWVMNVPTLPDALRWLGLIG
jgi:hypothetical protein